MTLRFMLVNDYNTDEVFEITGEEMGELAGAGAVFMCYKDSVRISSEVTYGVMAFHPSPIVEGGENGDQAFAMMVDAIKDVRIENHETHDDDSLITVDGRTLRVPVYTGPRRLN